MEHENALNFLLFSYFGITLRSSAEDIINAAISKAYDRFKAPCNHAA